MKYRYYKVYCFNCDQDAYYQFPVFRWVAYLHWFFHARKLHDVRIDALGGEHV